MLNDIIVVDNAVADPDRLRQLALVQQTYTCRDHEQIPGSWVGPESSSAKRLRRKIKQNFTAH